MSPPAPQLAPLAGPGLPAHAAPRRALERAVGLGALAASAIACSVAPESYSSDEERGSTHAVVTISRQELTGGATRADALAGFIRFPAATDRAVALELAGLGMHLPEPGHCWQGEQGRPGPELSDVAAIEFLEAGRVRVIADGGPPHELAPHVFPSVGDFISGVLYASRERSGQGLPAGDRYRFAADGGAVGTLDIENAAPHPLTDVTLNGTPFDALESVSTDEPLDVIWSGSTHPADRVYVELTSTRSSKSLVCAFEDAAGAGTLVPTGFEEHESAQLLLHRLRILRTPWQGSPVDEVELRLDFSQGHLVTFGAP